MTRLAPTQVEILLRDAVADFPHEPCYTCECFLGLVAQLSIDAEPAARPLLEPFKVSRQHMHACLGCDPCPPGTAYAHYMRLRRPPNIITI